MKKVWRVKQKTNKTSPLTGARDTDIEILLNVSDEDLKHMCQIDRYFSDLCKHLGEDFWKKEPINILGNSIC